MVRMEISRRTGWVYYEKRVGGRLKVFDRVND